MNAASKKGPLSNLNLNIDRSSTSAHPISSTIIWCNQKSAVQKSAVPAYLPVEVQPKECRSTYQ